MRAEIQNHSRGATAPTARLASEASRQLQSADASAMVSRFYIEVVILRARVCVCVLCR